MRKMKKKGRYRGQREQKLNVMILFLEMWVNLCQTNFLADNNY